MSAPSEAVRARLAGINGGSFTEKLIRVTFTLGTPGATFPGTQTNRLVLQGLRTSVKVTSVNRQGILASIEVWGMKADDMNALTVAWSAPDGVILENSLVIEVGDKTRMSEIFRGALYAGQPNYAGAPEVTFVGQAMGGYLQAITPFPDTSWNGSIAIVEMVKKILSGTDFSVVDGGATGTLSNPKFTGSRWQQMETACEATNTDWYVQGKNVILCAQNRPLSDIPAIILSPNTGLIGYPVIDRAGLMVKALFDPALACGSALEIRQSIVPYANGKWFPQKVDHMLEANLPDGKWESEMFCLRIES